MRQPCPVTQFTHGAFAGFESSSISGSRQHKVQAPQERVSIPDVATPIIVRSKGLEVRGSRPARLRGAGFRRDRHLRAMGLAHVAFLARLTIGGVVKQS